MKIKDFMKIVTYGRIIERSNTLIGSMFVSTLYVILLRFTPPYIGIPLVVFLVALRTANIFIDPVIQYRLEKTTEKRNEFYYPVNVLREVLAGFVYPAKPSWESIFCNDPEKGEHALLACNLDGAKQLPVFLLTSEGHFKFLPHLINEAKEGEAHLATMNTFPFYMNYFLSMTNAEVKGECDEVVKEIKNSTARVQLLTSAKQGFLIFILLCLLATYFIGNASFNVFNLSIIAVFFITEFIIKPFYKIKYSLWLRKYCKNLKMKEEAEALKFRIEVREDDITNFKGDVIVNAANKWLEGGSGVNGAIIGKAGAELLYCMGKLDGCATGGVKKTPSFGLEDVKAIYHAVGPIYSYYPEDEAEALLRSCYRKAMEQLIEDGYKSIAFPCISSGAYGYPLDKAVEIATDEVLVFLTKNAEACEDVLVCFYCYDEKAFDVYHKHLTDSSLLEKVNRL